MVRIRELETPTPIDRTSVRQGIRVVGAGVNRRGILLSAALRVQTFCCVRTFAGPYHLESAGVRPVVLDCSPPLATKLQLVWHTLRVQVQLESIVIPPNTQLGEASGRKPAISGTHQLKIVSRIQTNSENMVFSPSIVSSRVNVMPPRWSMKRAFRDL